MTEVTPLHRPTVESDADTYGPGDVVVDRDLTWLRHTKRDNWWLDFDGKLVHADNVAEPLTLIARAGETTDLVRARQTAIALEEQNAGLLKELRAQQGYLRAFQQRLDDFAENLLDANQDIEFTFRRIDPARGDE